MSGYWECFQEFWVLIVKRFYIPVLHRIYILVNDYWYLWNGSCIVSISLYGGVQKILWTLNILYYLTLYINFYCNPFIIKNLWKWNKPRNCRITFFVLTNPEFNLGIFRREVFSKTFLGNTNINIGKFRP